MKTRILLYLSFIFFTILLIGCASKERIVYKQVNTPIKCDIAPPLKPKYTGILIKDLTNLLIYAEQLERDLAFCTKEINDGKN